MNLRSMTKTTKSNSTPHPGDIVKVIWPHTPLWKLNDAGMMESVLGENVVLGEILYVVSTRFYHLGVLAIVCPRVSPVKIFGVARAAVHKISVPVKEHDEEDEQEEET